ncbi:MULTISPECIES: VirC2 family conjugal transfer protein [unclassified Neorhizobium]|uniref:VirC2 family conjugal transfer protein n=1 Tax=unclassified Neorhizobium TaxID=2629175 RepID=UPI001FF6AD5A|nr:MULTISPECIES: VirC2 family conjugal transfer protein [unclassified Neorhizobium]MCJ9674099.1 VirC2 family conjugal transfer protein [Neorhizobium sp. SHOUNA12B]MCJ9746279.1 VirC2 family conjugal transfer protein [Neorhizobium sp. SHOUNA12A]
MAIRKPTLSVTEARRLSVVRSAASQQISQPDGDAAAPSVPLPAAPVPHPKKQAPTVKPVAAPAPNIGRNPPKKVQVFVSAFVPAPKVSPVFDILCKQYPPQKALQMILRRALDDYEEILTDGTFQKSPESYPPDTSEAHAVLVQTSRMIPAKLLKLARAHFDPLELESARAFGLKLATAALAAFFAREFKR